MGTFGFLFRNLPLCQELTQAQIAEQLEVSKSFIMELEKNNKAARLYFAIKAPRFFLHSP